MYNKKLFEEEILRRLQYLSKTTNTKDKEKFYHQFLGFLSGYLWAEGNSDFYNEMLDKAINFYYKKGEK